MPRSLRVLIVDDNPADAELMVRELCRAGFEPAWKCIDTEQAFLAELENSPPEIILSDYSMPRFSGIRAALLLQESKLNIPFILISGTVGEEIAVECMKHGATDYLLKDRITRLGPAVEQALENKRLQDERGRADEEIREQLNELRRWHEVMLEREGRVLDLKREVNELLGRLNLLPRYSDADTS